MKNPTGQVSEKDVAVTGYDHPLADRKGDFLNRWPLAREIYGIATTGPKDWSVRIGVYGEWGTGKTSVLKFISTLAQTAGHIVIWFDPWQHSSKADLWRSFVLTVFKELESSLGHVPGASLARGKALITKAQSAVVSVTKVVNADAGKAIGAGIDLVKKHFDFSKKDLACLQALLGNKRVIILIDDLDRTAPELVPEILFALKELMDIPGFSFVCAFDPVVVGEVLGAYHPGFGTGLKFLDKIIDYPRWLPPASTSGLVDLALSDAKGLCSCVPEQALRDAVPMLPANPRSVRQFIRLLALITPQIERHYDRELDWPVILAANVLKVRHPRLAHALLGDGAFWERIGVIEMGVRDDDRGKKTREAITEHVASTAKKNAVSLEEPERLELEGAMLTLCARINPFIAMAESLSYQFNIAGAPAAVTWKEYDGFFTQWHSNQTSETISRWIDQHSRLVDRDKLEVYREVLNASVRRYAEILHQADYVLTQSERPQLLDQASSIFALLECLVFDLGQLEQKTKLIGPAELELIVDKFASFANSRQPIHKESWPRSEAMILKLFEKWQPDATPLMHVLNPFNNLRFRDFDGAGASGLHSQLCAITLPKFALQVIANFRQSGFVEHLIDNTGDPARRMLLDAKSQIWSQCRTGMFATLAEANSNSLVQENAYHLLLGLLNMRGTQRLDTNQTVESPLSHQALFDALWNAATASTLASRAVYQLRELPTVLQQAGIKCEFPQWWKDTLSSFIVPSQSPPATSSSGGGDQG
jgi:hypothetical protein